MASRTKVVDFEQFRTRRDRARLPLFDGVPLRTLSPARRNLASREVTHRQRMLAHLKASAGKP